MQTVAPARIGVRKSRTPEGFLRLHDVRISRVGDMTYGPGQTPVPVGPNGVAIITRDESVVFDAEALASWVGKPVTIGHPPATVTVDTWADLAHGHIENARRGSPPFADFMVGDVLVTRPDAIELADKGCEISGGYDAAYAADGVGRGRQTKIVGNHLAFLPDGIKGRCGELCYVGDQSMDVEEPKIMTDKVNAGTALLRKLFGAKDDADVARVLDEHAAAETTELLAAKDAQIVTLTADVARLTTALDEEKKKAKKDDDEDDDDAKKTMDAAAVQALHGRTVAAAEILSPGFKVNTFDAAGDLTATRDHLCGCQRQALEKAATTDASKAVVTKIVGENPDFSKMTNDQIEARFFAVADLMAAKNNTTLVELMKAGLDMNPIQDQFEATRAADERSRKKWARPAPTA